MIETSENVATFWRNAGQSAWWKKDDGFDAAFRERFLETHMAAARRELDAWLETAEGALALMVMLDQFPRNCFRGTGHMYATDALAKTFALSAIDAGHDHALESDVHVFFYLPLMHSEVLADQERCVALCQRLADDIRKSAIEHRDIVSRFGRFPHRNPMLGRITTGAERAFLDGGGFSG